MRLFAPIFFACIITKTQHAPDTQHTPAQNTPKQKKTKQDLFNIVAVDDFNMGAMENKSLNIFNSRLVLASPDSSSDGDYARIEGVVGNEYFHNWTGACVRLLLSGGWWCWGGVCCTVLCSVVVLWLLGKRAGEGKTNSTPNKPTITPNTKSTTNQPNQKKPKRQPRDVPRLVPAHAEGGPHRLPRPGVFGRHEQVW